MEAERLVQAGLRALAESGTAHDIVAEAWQARALAEAIGSHLALCGPRELRGEARGLSEAGEGEEEYPTWGTTGPRAARLTEVGDPRSALTALGELLGEVGIALVGVASVTDDEGLYWQCMEAIDAADEAGDRVRGMLRRLDVREQTRARPPDPPRGRADPLPAIPRPAHRSPDPPPDGPLGAPATGAPPAGLAATENVAVGTPAAGTTPRPAPEPARDLDGERDQGRGLDGGREQGQGQDREQGQDQGQGEHRERERDRARDR